MLISALDFHMVRLMFQIAINFDNCLLIYVAIYCIFYERPVEYPGFYFMGHGG